MCRTNLLYLLCLISNTMTQLEQSSLQPSTDLHRRHLLKTTSYNHLLLLHLPISRKGKHKQQQARTPPPPQPGGWEARMAFGPSTHYRIAHIFNEFQLHVRIYSNVRELIISILYMFWTTYEISSTFDRNSIFINNSSFTCGIFQKSGSEHTVPHVDSADQFQVKRSYLIFRSWDQFWDR